MKAKRHIAATPPTAEDESEWDLHSLNLGILHALRYASESLTPGSLLPSLRFGVTLSSLRVRYAPFGESPRVLPRSGSSLSQPLSERV